MFFHIISRVGLKFPWLPNHLPGRLINNKNTYPIRCFDQVFLYSMVFYVNILTGMASNNTISWSGTYDSTVQYQNTDLFPLWTLLCIADSSALLDELCPYFCLNPMVVHRKTCILMYLQNVYAPLIAKITFDTQNLDVSLLAVEVVSQTVLYHAGSFI